MKGIVTVKDLREAIKWAPDDLLVGHANSVGVVSTVTVTLETVTRESPGFATGVEYLDISK